MVVVVIHSKGNYLRGASNHVADCSCTVLTTTVRVEPDGYTVHRVISIRFIIIIYHNLI